MDHERFVFHEHDVHRFSHEDMHRWSGGGWRQEWRDGRYGWWWVVDGVWYYYDQPVYPYPTFVPEVIYVEPAPAPVPVPIPVAPAVAPAPLGPAPQQFWYYCDNPPGYYPYVASCSTNYREVPIPANGVAPQPAQPR